MNELLTVEEKQWVSFHQGLARLGVVDIVEFSKYIIDNGFKPIEVVEPVKTITYSELVEDDECDCPSCEDDYDYDGECWKITDQVHAEFLENCNPACLEDYNEWWSMYLKRGGKTTHKYNYAFNNHDWFILERSIEIPAFWGAKSLNIIVPSGIKPVVNKLGHNNVYYMKDFTSQGHFVPHYKGMVKHYGK